MKIEKKMRIGELAQILGVEKFVIRFWEKEFNLQETRSEGGQRFYSTQSIKEFKTIKTLLYEEKFTISGAKKFLAQNKKLPATKKTTVIPAEKISYDKFKEGLISIKNTLLALKENL